MPDNNLKKMIANYAYIFKNIFNRLSVESINQITILLTLPFIANSLGIGSFAIVSKGMIIIHLILLISDWGVDGYSIEKLNYSKDFKERNLFINSFFLLKLLLILFFIIILFYFLKINLLNLDLSYFSFIVFPILATSFLPLWFFQAIGKTEKLILPTLFGRSIFVILILFFVKNDESVKWFFISHGISSFIISFCGIIILFKMNYEIKLPNYKNVILHFKNSTSHFFLLITSNQFNTMWSTAIIFLGNSTSVAIFNLSNQILKAGMGISELIGRVVRQSTFNKNISHLKKVILFIIIFYFFSTIVGILLIDDILKYFFIDEYLTYIKVFHIIVVIWFLNALFKIFSYAFLTKIIDVKKANIMSIKIGSCHIIFLIFWTIFSKSYSIYSIIIYMFLACFSQLLILLIYAKFNKKLI